MNDAKINKMMKDIIFKNYLGDISEAKPFTITLFRQFAFSGAINPFESVKFVLIGDLAKWCSLKPGNSLN